MSITNKNLSSIQKAGQATHSASEAIARTVKHQAVAMTASFASKPFDAAAEHEFTQFRALARLGQDLIGVERQLQDIFARASELSQPDQNVVLALPQAAQIAKAADVEDAVVKVKEPKIKKASKAEGKKAGVTAKATKKAKVTTILASGDTTLTKNDQKLLDYLKTSLSSTEWTDMVGIAMAKGAGLPLGSVGISIKRLLQVGSVKKQGRSGYQLA